MKLGHSTSSSSATAHILRVRAGPSAATAGGGGVFVCLCHVPRCCHRLASFTLSASLENIECEGMGGIPPTHKPQHTNTHTENASEVCRELVDSFLNSPSPPPPGPAPHTPTHSSGTISVTDFSRRPVAVGTTCTGHNEGISVLVCSLPALHTALDKSRLTTDAAESTTLAADGLFGGGRGGEGGRWPRQNKHASQSLASYRRLVSLENKTESTIVNTGTNYYCAVFLYVSIGRGGRRYLEV
jgi:hypothetical protein